MNRGLEGSALLPEKIQYTGRALRKTLWQPVEKIGGHQSAQRFHQVQRYPAVAMTQRPLADPNNLSRREQPIEVRGLIVLDPGRQDLALQFRRNQVDALQNFNRVEKRIRTFARCRYPLPASQQPGE